MAEGQVVERKLAAIFAADVAEYSRLMGLDEVGTWRRLQAYRTILDRLIAAHRGRIFNTAGDSVVADFASAVDAVECAVAVQEAIEKENEDRPAAEQMRFRIGIHLGDVIVEGTNLFGDGVNIAARLQALAEPGRNLPFRRGARPDRLSAADCVDRARRAAGQEHRRAGARLQGRRSARPRVSAVRPPRLGGDLVRMLVPARSSCC